MVIYLNLFCIVFQRRNFIFGYVLYNILKVLRVVIKYVEHWNDLIKPLRFIDAMNALMDTNQTVVLATHFTQGSIPASQF